MNCCFREKQGHALPLVIPPGESVEFVVTLHIATHGSDFRDAATIYLEDNGRLREYQLAVEGQATPAMAEE